MIGRLATRVGLVGVSTLAGLIVMTGVASAAVDPVETAFDDMGSKITLYGTAIVALVVISAVLFLGIKYLRKGAAKA